MTFQPALPLPGTDVCSCRRRSTSCCPDAAAAHLQAAAPDLVAAADAAGIGVDQLAADTLAAEVRPHEPLATPRGWRLLPGRHVVDPKVARAVAAGRGLPYQIDRSARRRLADLPVRWIHAGLIVAARRVLAGHRLAEAPQPRLHRWPAPDGAVLGPASTLTHALVDDTAAWWVRLGSKVLTVDRSQLIPDGRCPASATRLCHTVATATLVVTADRQLVLARQPDNAVDGGLAAPPGFRPVSWDDAVADDDLTSLLTRTARKAAAQATGLPDDVPARTRLLAVTRDLAAAGSPAGLAVTVVGCTAADLTGSDRRETVALPAGPAAAVQTLACLPAVRHDLTGDAAAAVTLLAERLDDRPQLLAPPT